MKHNQLVVGISNNSSQSEINIAVTKEDIRRVDIWQNYGLSTFAPKNTPWIILYPNGDIHKGGAVLAKVNGAPILEENEVALWNSNGAIIKLKKDGTIEITGNLNINGTLHVTGKITTDGNVEGKGEVVAKNESPATAVHLSSHQHPNGNNGSPTGAPTAGS